MSYISLLVFTVILFVVQNSVVNHQLNQLHVKFNIIKTSLRIIDWFEIIFGIRLKECYLKCFNHVDCKSLNYNQVIKECQLSDKDRSDEVEMLRSTSEWTYLELKQPNKDECINIRSDVKESKPGKIHQTT